MVLKSREETLGQVQTPGNIREEDFSFMCCKAVAPVSVTVKKLRVSGKVFQSYDNQEESEIADAPKNAVLKNCAVWGQFSLKKRSCDLSVYKGLL